MTETLLYGRTLHGLETLASQELSARFGARVQSIGHREILFSGVEPTRLKDAGLLDDVFILCGQIEGLNHTRASLDRLRDSILREHVTAVRQAWKQKGALPQSLKVVASFLGRRNYNRFEIEAAVGEPLARALGVRLVEGREEEADSVLRVHMRDGVALLALRLFDRPLHRRAYKKVHYPGATVPQVARAIAVLAQIDAGMRVLDPYCGTCTILIEAGLVESGAAYYGTDISMPALLGGKLNAAAAGVTISLFQMSALALGFPDRCFDRILTNPPWGRQVQHRGQRQNAWSELRRVLRDQGRAVVLVHEPGDSHPGFLLESERHIRLSGQSSWLLSLRAV